MEHVFPKVVSEDVSGNALQDVMPLRDQHVLVVDSAVATRRIFQDQLNQLGAKSVVFTCTDRELDEQLDARAFALVICEYQLEGGRDGQQLLEELRVTQRLNWDTAFMMVTGERAYSKVVSVAEFQPDDYLIKPFSGAAFSERVTRVVERKRLLSEVYKARFLGRHLEVVDLCGLLLQTQSFYESDLMRMRVEALLNLGCFSQIEDELLNALEASPKPWMSFYLAKVYVEQGLFAEASGLLKELLLLNPEYVAASDLFAQVLWEQDQPETALDVLERMGPKVLGSSVRLRQLGHLSVRLGDFVRSKRYFSRLIERSANTMLFQTQDVLVLSKIYVEEGRYEEVEKLTARLRGSMQAGDLELISRMTDIQKDIRDLRLEKAVEKISMLFGEGMERVHEMEPETLTCLLEMCFAVEMQESGYSLVSLISQKKPSKSMLDRIRLAIGRCKKNMSEDEAGRLIGALSHQGDDLLGVRQGVV